MEFYSAIKSNQILIDAVTQINFKNIMLSDRSQAQSHMLHDFICMKCPE